MLFGKKGSQNNMLQEKLTEMDELIFCQLSQFSLWMYDLWKRFIV